LSATIGCEAVLVITIFAANYFFGFALLGTAARTAGVRRHCRRLDGAAVSPARRLFLDCDLGLFGSSRGAGVDDARARPCDRYDVNFWIAAALAGGTALGIHLLMRSPLGLGMLSVRDNEVAATSIGVDVWRNRFIAYVAAAAGCGLAGGVSFMAALFITVTTAFDLNWVVAMIFIVIIGGIGTIEGPIVGTAVFFGIRELFTNVFALTGSWYLIALGTVAVVTVLVAPTGIWPLMQSRLGFDWLSVKRDVPYSYAKDALNYPGLEQINQTQIS
jgi:branched-chain amino acid transport system permease protein